MKNSLIFKVLFLFISLNLISACEELEEIDARKRSEDTDITFSGQITTASDPFSVCETGTAATVTLDPEDNQVFTFTFSGTQELEAASALFQRESMTYSTATYFSGVVIANDTNDDFAAVATGCASLGGYAGVLEATLTGPMINGGQAISNATYTISARCQNSGEKTTFCSGTFSGATTNN